MTHFEQECRRVCKRCREGAARWNDNPPYHMDYRGHVVFCEYPVLESEFAERMAQEAKDARDNLAALVQGYPTFPKIQAERDKLAQEVERLREALQRAEWKLNAYVGVCKGDKELTDTVLPMARAALAIDRRANYGKVVKR